MKHLLPCYEERTLRRSRRAVVIVAWLALIVRERQVIPVRILKCSTYWSLWQSQDTDYRIRAAAPSRAGTQCRNILNIPFPINVR